MRYVLVMLTCLATAGSAAAQSGGAPGLPGVYDRRPDFRAANRPGEDPVRQSAPAWDANRDGVFTCDEWKQYVTRIFVNADANRDGFVDAKEFDALRRADPAFKNAELGYFDDNRDGRIARAEFVDRPSPFFARFDRNGDCKVTAEEMRGGGGGGPSMRPNLGGGGMGGTVGIPF
ncbi:EF-hand domain-containing protein [Rhodoplanes elegans]|nr:histidine kinase [Rhodoplanes elegans]